VRATDGAKEVGHEARQPQADQNQRDRQRFHAGARAARRGEERRAHDADDDRAHRDVLVAAGVLVEHPLGQEHQHEQAKREGGLDYDQRGEHQRHHLQRPAEHR